MTRLLVRSLPVLPLLVATVLCGAVRQAFSPGMAHGDGSWLAHLLDAGRVGGLAVPVGAHTSPFLSLLVLASPDHGWLATASPGTLVSIAATGWLAVSVGRLAQALGVARPWTLAAFVPLLPGVALNASPMASVDASWAAPCVLALVAAVERRSVAMLAWCGVALAVAPQAVCLAPFMVGLVLARRVPVRCWAALPAGYLAMLVPAWLAGAPLAGVIALDSVGDRLSLYAPNVWAIAELAPGMAAVPLTGLALAAATGASGWLVARVTTLRLDPGPFTAAALLSPLLVVGLLPWMDQRCFLLADVLALVWAGVAGTRATAYDAALVQAGSTLGLLAYGSGAPGLAALGALPMLWATVRVARTLLPRRAANDNPATARHPAHGSWPQFISE